MVMESVSMMVSDDVGVGDDKEALEIPLSREESWISLTPETNIVVSVSLCFANRRVLPGPRFSGYIWHHAKGEA
jgi:hypothetical protein